ncbi:hypothetical protein ACOMHN_046312 [Nucella lapillus]
MLGFKLKDSTRPEDLWPLVPEMMSLVTEGGHIVYPSNGLQPSLQNPLVVAMGNEDRSQAILSYHDNDLLTLDVQHQCSQEAVVPMNGPYTMAYVRTIDLKLQKLLTQWLERSVSLYVPIRRRCRGPRNYIGQGDDRLYETDHQETICDAMSPYQRVSIVQSLQFGRVLTLDDDVMLAESDDVYTTTVLGLDRGNQYSGTTVLILGGGDGGLLYRLVSLPQPPHHVIMAEIRVKDCVEVLKESAEKGEHFDYVVNDLTEFSVNKDMYGFAYDFKTNNIIMELSFRCLKEGGKYLARVSA